MIFFGIYIGRERLHDGHRHTFLGIFMLGNDSSIVYSRLITSVFLGTMYADVALSPIHSPQLVDKFPSPMHTDEERSDHRIIRLPCSMLKRNETRSQKINFQCELSVKRCSFNYRP